MLCLVRDGTRIWHHRDEARLTVRLLDEAFIRDYLAEVGEAALSSVGANQLEGRGIQIFYQNDKDWHYRKEERRWVSLNDQSSWRRFEKKGRKTESSILHIR